MKYQLFILTTIAAFLVTIVGFWPTQGLADCGEMDPAFHGVSRLIVAVNSQNAPPEFQPTITINKVLHDGVGSSIQSCFDGQEVPIDLYPRNLFIDGDLPPNTAKLMAPENLLISYHLAFEPKAEGAGTFRVCRYFFRSGLSDYEQFRLQRGVLCEDWEYESKEDYFEKLRDYATATRLLPPIKNLTYDIDGNNGNADVFGGESKFWKKLNVK